MTDGSFGQKAANSSASGRALGEVARVSVAIAITIFGVCSVAASPALAQVIPNEDELQGMSLPAESKPGWSAIVGVGAVALPTYPGAEDYKLRPVPIISLRYGNRLVAGPHGIAVTVIDWHGFRAGPLIGFNFGRKESRDPELTGLGDIPFSVEAGGFLSYSWGPIEAITEIRQAVTHTENGLTGKLSLRYHHALIPGKLYFSAGPELDFGNNANTTTWFGISPDQSAGSGLPVYAPRGGLTDAGLDASLTYFVTPHWLLRSFVNVREIVGDAADSPIVQKKTQTVFGTGIAYRF